MSSDALVKLATVYRTAQFYAHMAHNRSAGASFFGDHEFLGSLYGTYEDAYDAIIERLIGLGTIPDFASITTQASKDFSGMASDRDTDAFFNKLVSIEISIRKQIDLAISGQSQGTVNLLQGLADDSEARTYKLKQRCRE